MKHSPFGKIMVLVFIFPFAANAGTVTSDGDDLIINTKGGLEIKTADGSKSFQLGGRIQWDYDDTDSDDDAKDSKEFDVRRARLFVSGHVSDWAYKAQFNINDVSGTQYEDLYIRYTGFGEKANLTIGNQKEPFGLEEQTSSKDISVLERSAMTEAYVPGRGKGVQLHGKGSNWTYGLGVFESEDSADDLAVTGRATYTPIVSDSTLLHLGLAFTTRDGETSGDEFESIGIEAAYVAGPIHVQTEYFNAEDGNADVDGYYIQIGYVITGEMRPYKDGLFKKVKGTARTGAWEVVARYEDGHGKYSDVGLGTDEGSQYSLGLNWYANSNVRLGLSYMEGETDTSNLDGKEFRFRTQFTF